LGNLYELGKNLGKLVKIWLGLGKNSKSYILKIIHSLMAMVRVWVSGNTFLVKRIFEQV